jgi:hypothetical protein
MVNLIQEQELFFTSFEPQMQNRFVLYLDGVLSFLIKGTGRPKFTQEAKPLNHINVQRYVKGRTVWNPISLVLFSPVVPSATQAIMEWQRLHHESVTGRDGYADFYKKDLTINIIGPIGDKVEEWILKGCTITECDFGDVNFDQDDPLEIQLTVQPDFCVLNY